MSKSNTKNIILNVYSLRDTKIKINSDDNLPLEKQ